MENKTIKKNKIMNGTLINEMTLIKLKSLVYKIEGLESLQVFSKLTTEEENKLNKNRKKLNKLIKNL